MIFLQDASKLFTFMPNVKFTTIVILFIMVTSLILKVFYFLLFNPGFCFLDVPLVEGVKMQCWKGSVLPSRNWCEEFVLHDSAYHFEDIYPVWSGGMGNSAVGTSDCLSKVWHIMCRTTG